MALAPNRSRAKRSPFSTLADQLYPEDDPKQSATDEPDDDTGDEQDDAAGESPAQPMSQKDMADKVYPEKGRDDHADQEEDDSGETGKEDDDPEDADQDTDGDSDEETLDSDEQQGKKDNSNVPTKDSPRGKTAPKVINGSKSESYDTYVKTGGSRSWQNNNPGNIEYRKQPEAIGAETAGRFAKFPTEAAGMAALKKLLGTTYKDWDVKDLMTKKYAPPGGKDKNNPEAYVEFLGKHGVDLKKPVGQQVDVMSEAIKQQEGWIPGTIKNKK